MILASPFNVNNGAVVSTTSTILITYAWSLLLASTPTLFDVSECSYTILYVPNFVLSTEFTLPWYTLFTE